jgi:hypothetical protein
MIKLLLIPLFLHIILIFMVGSRMLRSRIKSVRSGAAKISEVAVDAGAWPRRVQAIGNNFDSQFDLPTLWYAVCALLVSLQLVDIVQVVLSWVFLVCRFAHTAIHIGNNDVPSRMRVYLAGFFVILLMWGWFGIKLFAVR